MVRPTTSWICCCALLVPFLLPSTAAAERVLVASNAVYVVETETGDVQELVKLGLFVKDLAVDASGSLSYAATSDGVLEIDLATGDVVRNFGQGPARALELDEAAGTLYGLFTMGEGVPAQLRTFSLGDGQLLHSKSVPSRTTSIGWDATANSVIGVERGVRALHLYEANMESERNVIRVPERVGKPGVNTLAPETVVHEASGTVVIPELGAEAGVWVIRPGSDAEWIGLGHEAHFRGGVISADGRFLYLSALDHVAKVDLIERREVAWVGVDVIHQRIALSADGNALFLTVPVDGESGALSILSAETLLPIRKITVPNASPFALAVVPD